MLRRRAMVRRGPGLLGAVAVGGAAYAAGRAGAQRSAHEEAQRIADLQAAQAAPARRTHAAPSSGDRISQLQDLAQLKASGVLTEEEFLDEKKRILSGG